jgi:hypothetical protein
LHRFRVFEGAKAFLRTDDQFPFCSPVDFCGVAAPFDEWKRKLMQERTDIFELVVVEEQYFGMGSFRAHLILIFRGLGRRNRQLHRMNRLNRNEAGARISFLREG